MSHMQQSPFAVVLFAAMPFAAFPSQQEHTALYAPLRMLNSVCSSFVAAVACSSHLCGVQ